MATDCLYNNDQLTIENKIETLAEMVEKVIVDVDRCAYSSPHKKPQHLIYLFEGRSGLSKKLLIEFKKFQAQNPKCIKNEKNEEVFIFPDGKWILAKSIKDQFDNMVRPETGGSPVGLKSFIIEGFCRSGINFQETEVVLWGQEEGIDAALKCVTEHNNNRYDGVHRPTLMVMGFSRGGSRAIEFADAIHKNKKEIVISQGVTVDPVPTGLGETVAKFVPVSKYSKIPATFSIAASTPWDNFWQESDSRWGGRVGLNGSAVAGASKNVLVKPSVEKKSGNGAHWRIFQEQMVQDSIRQQLQRVNGLSGQK